jgi:hypothetical protein
MVATLSANARAPRPRRARQGRPRRRRVAAVRRRELRPRARPRGPAPPAGPAAAFAEFHIACCDQAADRVRRRAVAVGDRLARLPKQRRGCSRQSGGPLCVRAQRQTPQRTTTITSLRGSSTSMPSSRRADRLRSRGKPGFTDINVRGEELLANWFGWFNRALEASADPVDVPILWRKYAFHGYIAAAGGRQGARATAAASAVLQPAAERPPTVSSRLARDFPLFPLELFPWAVQARRCRCTSSRSATRR